jgi:hypothetical protein
MKLNCHMAPFITDIVLGVLFLLLGDSPLSEFYVPIFQNTLSFQSS